MCTVFGAARTFDCVQYTRSFLPFTVSVTSIIFFTLQGTVAITRTEIWPQNHGGKKNEITTICIGLRAIRNFHRRDCEVYYVLGCEVLQYRVNTKTLLDLK